MTPDTLIVFDGQSLSVAPAGASYPWYVTALLAQRTRWVLAGIAGTTYAARDATVAVRVDARLGDETVAVLHDDAGTSELIADQAAATILATVKTYHEARRAAGFTHIARATLTGYTGMTAAENTERQAFNELLRDDPDPTWDVLVDWDADPTLAAMDAAVSSDGTHFNAVGHTIIASLLANALADLDIT